MSQPVRLPDAKNSSDFVDWRLTQTGLEWDGGAFSARWMPFGCMRRICLGRVPGARGWHLRISGPPGAILMSSGPEAHPDYAEREANFAALAKKVLVGAGETGCQPALSYMSRAVGPGFLWARLGRPADSVGSIIARLPASVT